MTDANRFKQKIDYTSLLLKKTDQTSVWIQVSTDCPPGFHGACPYVDLRTIRFGARLALVDLKSMLDVWKHDLQNVQNTAIKITEQVATHGWVDGNFQVQILNFAQRHIHGHKLTIVDPAMQRQLAKNCKPQFQQNWHSPPPNH